MQGKEKHPPHTASCPAPLWQPTYPVGAALAVDVLQHSLIQAQFQAGLVKHLPLVGVPGDEAIDLHRLALPDPVAASLSLGGGGGHSFRHREPGTAGVLWLLVPLPATPPPPEPGQLPLPRAPSLSTVSSPSAAPPMPEQPGAAVPLSLAGRGDGSPAGGAARSLSQAAPLPAGRSVGSSLNQR